MRMRKNQAKLAMLEKKQNAPLMADKISLRDAIARVQLALKCDMYYPLGEFDLNGEVVTDFRDIAKKFLGRVTEKGYKDKIIELAMTIPPLRTASKDLGKQLDWNVPNWRQMEDRSLCYLYSQALKQNDEAIYAPLANYLGLCYRTCQTTQKEKK